MLGARWGIILWPRGSARFSLCLVKGSVNSHRYKLRAEEAGGISEGATGKRTVPSCLYSLPHRVPGKTSQMFPLIFRLVVPTKLSKAPP